MSRSLTDHVIAHVDRVESACSADGTPLLADGLDLASGKQLRWSDQVTANFACQQNHLRTLGALSSLTGDTRYHERADAWTAAALDRSVDATSGLLYWGGHSSYDLQADEPIVGNHEMKCVYPHYAYLHRVRPDLTARFIEACWHAHIWDWQTLLFNRHGIYEPWEPGWHQPFGGGPLPIVENTALSFINTGSDLILSGVLHHSFTGAPHSLAAAMNLLSRYDQVRHPETGLGAYQFNHRDPCRVRASFKAPYDTREDVNETTVVTDGVIKTRYGRAAVTFANALGVLGEPESHPLRDFIVRDLTALAEHSYDTDQHAFIPCLNDGTRLDPSDSNEGVGYCPPSKLKKVPADGLMFLSYARAYRVTREARFLDVARSLADGMGWPSLEKPLREDGPASPADPHGWVNTGQNDAAALFGLLDLHDATGEPAILDGAATLARHILPNYEVDGFLVSDHPEGETSIDSALPLALLHIEAASQGSRDALPAFYPNNTYFDPKIVIRQRKEAE